MRAGTKSTFEVYYIKLTGVVYFVVRPSLKRCQRRDFPSWSSINHFPSTSNAILFLSQSVGVDSSIAMIAITLYLEV